MLSGSLLEKSKFSSNSFEFIKMKDFNDRRQEIAYDKSIFAMLYLMQKLLLK